VLKQLGVNLISGKSLTGVSLPINIFEPKSFVEKAVEFLKPAPIYLE